MGLVPRALLLTTILFATLNATTDDLTKAITGIVHLEPGTTLLHHELVLPANAHDLAIDGHHTTLQLAPDFQGRAAIVISGAHTIAITGLTIDGNRAHIPHPVEDLPKSNVSFAQFTRDNGILVQNGTGIIIENVSFQNIAGFPILINASEKVTIRSVTINDSGSLNGRKRNNATGGILLEEGTREFEVSGSTLDHVLGNGIWTHSLFTSPRNADGVISGNRISDVARDAIQIGHATRITVSKNAGTRIGYPLEAVDREAEAIPAALDTAGNVDATRYDSNEFTEVNGKCIDLDGFHDSEVRNNSCINNEERDAYPNGHYGIVMNNSNPDMQSRNILIWGNRVEGFLYGGLLVIGSGHQIRNNHFLRLNMAHCNDEAVRYGCLYAAGEPDLLRSGIYLRDHAERLAQTRDNVIENNEMTGFGIGSKCVVAGPHVLASDNRIGRNRCGDDAGVSARASYRSITREIAFTSLRNGGSAKSANVSNSPSRQVE